MCIYKKSPIDDLFKRLMGYYPKKAGTAYEIISTVILGLIEDKDVKHNQYLKGQSDTVYQLDGLIDDRIMIESKDYTLRDKEVGRGDLQKLEGALTDLPNIQKGYFTSATDYTEPARKYAESSSKNPLQKEIVPIELRPSTIEDMANRITKIPIMVKILYPNFEEGKYKPVFSNDGVKQSFYDYLRTLGVRKVTLKIDVFYDSNGNVVDTMRNLLKKQIFQIPNNAKEIDGVFDISAFIKLNDRLFEISGIEYHMPISFVEDFFTIESKGSAVILIRSERLGINKLITDTDIREAIDCVIKSGIDNP